MALEFITRSIIAGIGVALVAGPLGSIVVWRRMANFGDALAHSTLLGLCFALLFNVHIYIGLMSTCLLAASLLALFARHRYLANDTVLCMLAYTALAMGLILATCLPGIRMDLLGYLYGDILSVDTIDLLWIFGVDLVVLFILMLIWRPVLSMTIHEDLARVEGVPVVKMQWLFVALMAIVFAVAMKLVGVLLITALLIIPASGARHIAKTPEQMAVIASLLGSVSVYTGMTISSHWDWPAGPAIVVSAMAVFVLSGFVQSLRQR